MKYYKVREIVVDNKKEVLIVECEDRDSQMWLPSRLTDFINTQCRNLELNTKIFKARAVTQFMNFVVKEVMRGEDEVFCNLKEEGLYGLEFDHLARYINYISNANTIGNKYDTVKSKERVLLEFYSFLFKRGITSKDTKIETKVVQVTTKNEFGTFKSKQAIRVNINPLLDKQKYCIKYPKKNHLNRVLKDLDVEIWEQLIEYAEQYYPQIAFGIAMQCMGGLRQGEVVNLIISDIQVQRESNRMIASIKERPELFIDRRIMLRKSQTKKSKPREQVIYNFNKRLFEIYESHLSYIAKKSNERSSYLGALFIDAKGNPMSGDSYEANFRRLKRDFIEEIYNVAPALAHKLENYKWGSHIGRHIFTNYLLKQGGVDNVMGEPSAKLLQYARGDDNIQSADTYIDTVAMHEAITNNINKMSKISRSMNTSKEEDR